MTEYHLHLIPERCNGCMECVKACPLDAPAVKVIERAVGWDVVICRHCNPAPCAEACEFGAITVQNGAVVLDSSLCTSCKACIAVCPFGAVFLLPSGDINKCDLCSGEPACVKACTEGAILYEPAGDRLALLRNSEPISELLEIRGLR